MSSPMKFKDGGPNGANNTNPMPWPTDVFAIYLAPETIPAPTDLDRSQARTPPAAAKDSGASTATKSTRLISQELSNLVWGSTLTALALLLFEVGFTNKLAIGLWTPAVIVTYVVALLMTRLREGSVTPLVVWNAVMLFFLQLTVLLSSVRCLVLEVTGSRSYTIVALSMLTMMCGTKATHRSNWWWVVGTGVVQLVYYIIFGFVDAFAGCTYGEGQLVGSYPNAAVVQLFQQIVPVAMLCGSAIRVYAYNAKVADQLRISEDFALKCMRAAFQSDVEALLAAAEEYDENPPPVPSVRDDAMHTVIGFLHNLASRPTLVAPILLGNDDGVGDDEVRPLGRVNSEVALNRSPLQKMKANQLLAVGSGAFASSSNHINIAGGGGEGSADEGFPHPHENQPDGTRSTTDVRKMRERRLGSIHGNLTLPNDGTNSLFNTTRPSTGNGSLVQVGLASKKYYLVLFALPKLSSYMMSSQKNINMAEMFLGEFAEVVSEVLEKWEGSVLTAGLNFVVGKFINLPSAIAATVEAQMKMQGHAGHHKDITLNMLSANKLLTLTVVGEALIGRPNTNSRWAFGYTAAERVFDGAIQAFATREPLPANLISTNLTGGMTSYFEFRPSPIHTTLMTVLKASTVSDGSPVLPDAARKTDPDLDIELQDLPQFDAVVPKHRPIGTAADGSRPKTKIARPPSGLRAQTANQPNKVRKGLPAQVLEVWNTIDIDGNGYLDLMEMETLIKKIGLGMSKSEIRDFFKKIDVDGSGSLSIDEFEDAYYSSTLGGASVISSIRRSAMAMAHSNEKEFISLVEKSWRKYDVDGSGKLDQQEVGNILKDLGMTQTAEELKWMFDRMDRDKSGFVEFDEFMALFSADASEFMAVKERIQAVSRVMIKSSSIYSTPDQALRDYRVWVLEIVDMLVTPFVFGYVWYMFCSTSYYIAAGTQIPMVTITQSMINFCLDAIYATWCIAKFLYLPKESRGTVTFKDVWRKHIRTTEWWVDLITIIPADILFYIIGSPLNGGEISFFRVNKLLCIYHLDERYKLLTAKFNPAVARAANALMLFFVVCHVLACVLIRITRSLGADTTEDLVGINGVIDDESIIYVVPLYWAILTLSGQLSGASMPTRDIHAFLLLGAVFVGLPLYTVVLGTIGNAVTVEDSYTRYLDKIDMLRSFFEYTRLSADFESEIIDYYKHLYTTTGSLDITENPLDDLPTELSIPVVIAMGTDMLKAVPIFKDASANMEFVHELTIKLVPKVIEPLAMVMKKGEIGAEMYFITFGNFNIVIDTGKIVFTLGKGNFFGEIALLHSGKRTATIVNSHRFGNVLMLVKDQFQEVARFFPDCLSQVYKAAEDRIKQTKENEAKEKEAADKAAKEAREKELAKLKEENGGITPEAKNLSPMDSGALGGGAAGPPPLPGNSDAFAKPMSPALNAPAAVNTQAMGMQLQAIGYAMTLNRDVFAPVPVEADTNFDNETRNPADAAGGGNTNSKQARRARAGRNQSSSFNTKGSENTGTTTYSDFDDDDEDDDSGSSIRSANDGGTFDGSTSYNTTAAASGVGVNTTAHNTSSNNHNGGIPPLAPTANKLPEVPSQL